MPFMREHSKHGYILEIDYTSGDSDYESAGNVKSDAIKQVDTYKNDENVKAVRLYPMREDGQADVRGDPIYQKKWKR